MDSGSIAQLRVAIDRASEPITGLVSIEGETSRRFNGWIELVAMIEAARQRRPDERRPGPTARPGGAGKHWGCSLG